MLAITLRPPLKFVAEEPCVNGVGAQTLEDFAMNLDSVMAGDGLNRQRWRFQSRLSMQ
jgi:hypothetical protein